MGKRGKKVAHPRCAINSTQSDRRV
jgi:hypothetical protein